MKNLTRTLITIVLFLITMGSVFIFSTKGYSYLFSHASKIIFAIGAFVVFAVVPYSNYKSISKWLLIGIVVALFYTLLFAPSVKGASRWLNLGFISFQPSEIAKIFLLMHLAVMMDQRGEKIKDFKEGLMYMLIWVGVVSLLIFLQPNVSNTIIVVFTSLVLLYVGGARFYHLGGLVGILAVIGGIGAMTFSHSRARIMTFVNSIIDGGNINLQVLQSKIALGSGGMFGRGIGLSRQSDLFLPEPHNDFMFSVVGEELGFIGALLILLAYMAIFIVGVMIAKRAKDDLGQLLAFGISFLIILNAFIHVAVGLGLLPTTGITLPFMSFGGTSIIIFSISIGILMNIAIRANKHQQMRRARA